MTRMVRIIFLVAVIVGTAFAQNTDWRSWPVRIFTPRPYDVLHYRIEMRFDHPRKQFFGVTTITLLPVGESLSSCTFDAEVLEVQSATSSDGRPLAFTQRPGSVTVHFPREISPAETVQVTIRYEGKQIEIDPERWGVSNNYHLGIEFFDSTAAHPALISALSFPTGARHFFPCNDHPADKATQEMIIEVPAGWKALSNGTLLDVRPSASGGSVYHWYLRQPHSTYLSQLAAGPYVVLRDSLGSLPLSFWVYPRDIADAPRSFNRTREMITFFEGVYGVKYPWDKYDQITVPGIGGGAEATTATNLSQNTIHDKRAEQDFPSHWLVAHELAHQWWGNFVTLKDWGHTWINESFATYSEYLYSAWSLGDDEGALNLHEKRQAYFREARTKYRRPIVLDRWQFPNQNFDSHTYPKGANVLHMLRMEIGEEAFSAFLKAVLTKHAYGSATTDDLLRRAEQAAGRSLEWFFDQWLRKPGHPVLNVSWRWDEAGQSVFLRVEQKQDTSDGTSIFTFPVFVGLTTATGHSVAQIRVTRASEEFRLPSPERPILVEFDEPHIILAEVSFPRSSGELILQLERGNALSRILAAQELAPLSDDPVVDAVLRKASREDTFWGTRRAAINALSARSASVEEFLKDRIGDPSSKVRAAVVRKLSSLKSPRLVSFLIERFDEESSYVVQAELVRAIANIAHPAVKPFLVKASQLNSHRDLVREAALQGLKDLTE
ncbi:MAG: aminopeptidase [Bacteroidia bacterium]|nr:MAG: aminopeptidase [Bacteroidia bacterium]